MQMKNAIQKPSANALRIIWTSQCDMNWTCADPEGGGGGQGVRTPMKITKNIGLFDDRINPSFFIFERV